MNNARAASLFRPVPAELADAPLCVVCHGEGAFELFKVRADRATDAVYAKRALWEDGFVARSAAVVLSSEVRSLHAAGVSLEAILDKLAGAAPSLPEFDNLAQFNSALAYRERMRFAIGKALEPGLAKVAA